MCILQNLLLVCQQAKTIVMGQNLQISAGHQQVYLRDFGIANTENFLHSHKPGVLYQVGFNPRYGICPCHINILYQVPDRTRPQEPLRICRKILMNLSNPQKRPPLRQLLLLQGPPSKQQSMSLPG